MTGSQTYRIPTYDTTIPTTSCTPFSEMQFSFIQDIKSIKVPVDVLVMAIKSTKSDTSAASEKTTVDIPSAYDDEVKQVLTPFIVKKTYTGKEGTSLVMPCKLSFCHEIGIVGLGQPKPTQFSILETTPCSHEPKDTISPIVATQTGKMLSDIVTASSAKTMCLSFHASDITVEGFQCILESMMLGLCSDQRFKSQKSSSSCKLEQMFVHVVSGTPSYEQCTSKAVAYSKGTLYTKDLASSPSNYCTTESLAKEAMALGKMPGFECKVLGEKECMEHKMGAYLSVHAGSKFAPQFIHLTYKGEGTPKQKLCFVGKGICMDTGGYNLKVGAQIEKMKYDMSAAAALLGTAKIISCMKPSCIEVHFVIPAAENMIDSKATRPGDIITASDGKTIEIGNTDAEGRLVLADALIYAESVIKPDCIIDSATLTGACMVGLGQDIAAIYGTDSKLTMKLLQCAKSTGTSLWPLPLYEPYRKLLDSHYADICNVAMQRYGGSIQATLFLKEFVKQTPWCHIDMAGPAYDGSTYVATGYGAKLFAEFVLKCSLE